MANDKNPLDQLKDLVELKDQLEDIQRRVEDEIQAGVPPGGSLLASPFLKGFLAGYIVARLRSSALLGVAVGTCTGIYAAQNYSIPNVENTIKDYISNLKGGHKWEDSRKSKNKRKEEEDERNLQGEGANITTNREVLVLKKDLIIIMHQIYIVLFPMLKSTY